MDRMRFRRLVHRALRSLPPEVHDALNNVAIVIEREPSAEDLRRAGLRPGQTLFGLYVGIPLTERSDYGLTLPDRIVIYQGPLERHFHPRDIPREVATTVRHELAHHFGIDDPRLDALGLG
ncbi:MAG: metallopeptidase family protein [Dehalococcoidia bacterium]